MNWFLTGCSPVTGTGTTTTLPAVTLPTVATLTGTWNFTTTSTRTETSTDSTTGVVKKTEVLETMKDTLVFKDDGTFLQKTTITFVPQASRSNSYSETKGTFTTSNDTLTLLATMARKSSTAFPDETTGWASYGMTFEDSRLAILSGGTLYYRTVFRAQGSVSGLLGTWTSDSYTSIGSPDYQRSVLHLDADGTYWSSVYTSKTSTFPTEPSSKTSGTYTASSGVLTTTQLVGASSTPLTQSGFYRLFEGPYVVFGPDSVAYLKQ